MLRSLAECLSSDELRRARRFHFARDRRRSLVGKGLLRTILSKYVDVEPTALVFVPEPLGKPRLEVGGVEVGIRFSMSDSHGLGGVAVSRGLELGLDIERVRANLDYESIANREFAPPEVDAFRSLPSGRRLHRFFDLWTCKEAYLKALGVGLTEPLSSFAVDVARPDSPRLLFTELDPENRRDWRFYRLPIDAEYAACLVVEGDDHTVSHLRAG